MPGLEGSGVGVLVGADSSSSSVCWKSLDVLLCFPPCLVHLGLLRLEQRCR